MLYYLSFILQLVTEREQLVKSQKVTESIKATMEGHVRHEKERFERLARQMKNKEKDLALKSDQLRQVKEVIKNSPLVSSRSTALKESNTPNVKADRIKVHYKLRCMFLTCIGYMHMYMYVGFVHMPTCTCTYVPNFSWVYVGGYM